MFNTTMLEVAGVSWTWLEASWLGADAPDRLATDVVYLWRGRVNRWLPDNDAAGEVLTASEQARAARITHIPRRNQFLALHMMVRTLMGRYLNVAPEQAPLLRRADGRTTIAGMDATQPLHLSMCHATEYLLAAVSRCRCGVDMEPKQSARRYSHIVRHLLANTYRHALLQGDGAPCDQALLFSRCWTALEAVYKLQGEGGVCRYYRNKAAANGILSQESLRGCHFTAFPDHIGAAVVSCASATFKFIDADIAREEGLI